MVEVLKHMLFEHPTYAINQTPFKYPFHILNFIPFLFQTIFKFILLTLLKLIRQTLKCLLHNNEGLML